jgi:large subunit ribosomal protein L30e
MVDINKALKDVAKKGTITIGEKQTKQAITKQTAKAVILAKNCPYAATITPLAEEKHIPVYVYHSSGVDLGHSCGKNYAVAAFAVINEGESNILSLIKPRK